MPLIVTRMSIVGEWGINMGVMACDRFGCENIMCNKLILDGEYYICHECFAELKHEKDNWPTDTKARDVFALIKVFMDSRPYRNSDGEETTVEDEFNRLTKW